MKNASSLNDYQEMLLLGEMENKKKDHIDVQNVE